MSNQQQCPPTMVVSVTDNQISDTSHITLHPILERLVLLENLLVLERHTRRAGNWMKNFYTEFSVYT